MIRSDKKGRAKRVATAGNEHGADTQIRRPPHPQGRFAAGGRPRNAAAVGAGEGVSAEEIL